MTDHFSKIMQAIRSGSMDQIAAEIGELSKTAAIAESYKRQAEMAWAGSDKLASFIKEMYGDVIEKKLPLTGVHYVDATTVWPMRWKAMQLSCEEFVKLYREIEKSRKDIENHLLELKNLKP